MQETLKANKVVEETNVDEIMQNAFDGSRARAGPGKGGGFEVGTQRIVKIDDRAGVREGRVNTSKDRRNHAHSLEGGRQIVAQQLG